MRRSPDYRSDSAKTRRSRAPRTAADIADMGGGRPGFQSGSAARRSHCAAAQASVGEGELAQHPQMAASVISYRPNLHFRNSVTIAFEPRQIRCRPGFRPGRESTQIVMIDHTPRLNVAAVPVGVCSQSSQVRPRGPARRLPQGECAECSTGNALFGKALVRCLTAIACSLATVLSRPSRRAPCGGRQQ